MKARYCTSCGSALTPDAHFCANCGAAVEGPAAGRGTAAGQPAAPANAGIALLLPWFALAAVMMLGLGYAIGSRGAPPQPAADPAFASADNIVLAPDISSLSPEERVDRLFNRVMALAAAGKQDSVQFFAPMAINALSALMPFDAHRRYDLGLIELKAGDPFSARAQADTILAEQPSHLLGLSLAMRAARAQGRDTDVQRFAARLTAAEAEERAKGLREYAEHAPDLADALREAGATR